MLSKYGNLHKATLFDRGAGLQALVQFTHPASASAAARDLGGAGRPLPAAALPVSSPPVVRAFPSRHADLNVRFQSHRSRDFLDETLPFGRAGTGGGGGGAVAAAVGGGGGGGVVAPAAAAAAAAAVVVVVAAPAPPVALSPAPAPPPPNPTFSEGLSGVSSEAKKSEKGEACY